MKTFTLQVPDSKTTMFLNLAKQLGYAKKVKFQEESPTSKAEILEVITKPVEDVKMTRAGKIKEISARNLLDEL